MRRRRILSALCVWLAGAVFCLSDDGMPPAATSAPIFQPEDAFQFVVTSDLYGGNRPGVFENALRWINTLQPSFVVTVGDLILGKPPEEDVLNAHWDRFYKMLEPLTCRFYFVPGNHDFNRPEKARIYRRRVGSPYYSFDFGGCHFLVMNSNDGVKNTPGISDEQMTFIQEDLAAHQDAKHTFLFLHHPFFMRLPDEQALRRLRIFAGMRAGMRRWPDIAAALGERPYTVFSGHVHRYTYYSLHGRDHYILGTTGGGSMLRGPEYGEFDHFAVVTVRKDTVRVSMLLVNGFVPVDVVDGEKARTLIESQIKMGKAKHMKVQSVQESQDDKQSP